MTLALAIPVWNDAGGLAALLRQVAGMRCFSQVVIVDDGSDQTIDLADRVRFPVLPEVEITVLRNERACGAGQARNRALTVVRTDHLLFFDSDDLLTDEFPRLWQDLAGRMFDFCIFKHTDSRVGDRGGWGQEAAQEALWRLAGCATGALSRVDPAAALCLAETANYPWNKVYRTAFLRAHDLRCTEIPVHNDIALHWRSFVHGRRILASDRICAVHYVRQGGARLTNRRGAERLRVIDPLEQVASDIRAHQGAASGMMLALLRFASGLLGWARANIEPVLQPDMDRAAAGFLIRYLDRDTFAHVTRCDPVLALRLGLQMRGGQG